MIVVLTGGTGGAKLVDGLYRVVGDEALTCIVNTGDDFRWWGLHVSPDIDSVVYALAGMLSPERGWGVRDDTFFALETMRKLGEPDWFQVGDRDLAIHLVRTKLLKEGRTLSAATATIAEKLGVEARILPMSDSAVETRVETEAGELNFQEYFVKRRHRDPVTGVRLEGAAEARPAPGVVEAIRSAQAIVLAPSNPITSIGPILAVPGIRAALRETAAGVIAVSPMVGDRAFSGPAADLMAMQGLPVSIAGVAKAYEDFLDVLIVDSCDADAARGLERQGIEVHCENILLRTNEDKIRLARVVLAQISRLDGEEAKAS
ncbi:MAG TPA: 2-phospho-L-lactate transferase [Terriglobales bacterium]